MQMPVLWRRPPFGGAPALYQCAKGAPPTGGRKRSQIQYQFPIWKKLGTRAASAASSKSDYQIKIIVESRVAQRGGVGALQELAFASVAQSRLLVHLRPSFMPTKIAALRRSTQVITFFTERVHQVMEQIVRSYARRASAVTSSSADFEFHRYASQQQLKKTVARNP